MVLGPEHFGPLAISDPLRVCPECKGKRHRRKKCLACGLSGYQHAMLQGKWSRPGFLVCGGPSINDLDHTRLQERGVVSLGVNNIAAHVPVDAWCFSDGQTKFHHGLFFDPKMMTFCPTPKLRKHVRMKVGEEFRVTNVQVEQCPNTWGFQRSGRLYPEHFFDTWYAQWGFGGRQDDAEQPFRRLCTMLLGIRLMHYLGCRKIFMLGVDFWIDAGQPYAFNQAKGGGNGAWKKNEEMLRLCAQTFAREGLELFNCNPRSQLDLFPYVSYDVAVEQCKGLVPSGPLDLRDWYTKSITREFRAKYPEALNIKEKL